VYNGKIVLDLENSSANKWVADGMTSRTSVINNSGGGKSLSAELTTVRLTTVNGTDPFDAGEVNVSYEG
jgi:hypothetical protein